MKITQEGVTINDEDAKAKIIKRIKRERIGYKESFNKSLINQYSITSKVIYINDNSKKETYITAPKYTDDSRLVQAYNLAHELGHHVINKELNPNILKLVKIDNMLIKNIIERKAWKEAENICKEESIPIGSDFYLTRDKCLNTYTEGFKISVKCGFNFIFNIIKTYYLILMSFYLIYKGVKDGIIDMFGMFKYFSGIDVGIVNTAAKNMWIIYVMFQVSKSIRKLIRKMFIKKGEFLNVKIKSRRTV